MDAAEEGRTARSSLEQPEKVFSGTLSRPSGRAAAVRPEHLRNTLPPRDPTLSGTMAVVRDVQFSNALSSMRRRLSGKVGERRAVQFLNAPVPMTERPSAKVTRSKAEQSRKALSSMTLTLEGISTAVRPVQPLKAFFPMSRMPSPIWTERIWDIWSHQAVPALVEASDTSSKSAIMPSPDSSSRPLS